MSRRFRYPLEPLLMIRGWRVDEATRGLAERQEAVAAQEQRIANLVAERAELDRTWHAGNAPGTMLTPALSLAYSRYVARLAARTQDERASLAQLERERQEAVDLLGRSLREQDAVRRDKIGARRRFEGHCNTMMMHETDERWVVRRTRIRHDNEA